MERYVDITVTVPGALPALTTALGRCFGDGSPGWLARDVPPGTAFDMREGTATTCCARFVRSPASGRWARAN